MQKIVIANVSYTQTDETYYVLNSSMEDAQQYAGGSLEETAGKLKAAGWQPCGKVQRADGVNVDMMTDGSLHYIALWEEQSE